MERNPISYGRQTIEEDDVRAVIDALTSGMLTQGPLVEEFEEALKRTTGARYAVCCSNGTAALHLAVLAAGVGEGDCVLTSPVTFLASANAGLYAGAGVEFADIDPDTLNIDTRELKKRISSENSIKALIPVHFAGLPCAMEDIKNIAGDKGLIVIEDACHALGASWKDSKGEWRKVGSCSHSDMTVFSFHPVKSITTGEGGAVTTNSPELYERLKELRSHGVTKDAGKFVNRDASPWYYEMQELGFNYRLSDIQCALGISQLRKLERFIGRRAQIAELYTRLLSKYQFIKTPSVFDGRNSAFHLYPVRIDFDGLGVSKAEWFSLMKNIGINLQVHYIPVHLQPYYAKRFGLKRGDFPNAESFYSEEVSLPIYPLLKDEEAGAVVEAIVSTLAYAASRPAKAV